MKKILLLLIAIITVTNLIAKDVPGSKKSLKSATIKTPTKKYAVGGPDTYGYTWIDSDEASLSYTWQDISSTGNEVTLDGSDDDDYYGSFPIGFSFPFYDTSYTEFYFGTNGALYFEDTEIDYDYYSIPSSYDDPASFIAWHWTDLEMDDDEGSAVYYETFDSYTIVQFENYQDHSDTDYYATMQVVLYEDGNIELRYKTLDPYDYDEEFVVGIQKDDTDGLQVAYDDDTFFEDGKSVLIVNPNNSVPVPFSIYSVFVLFILVGGLTVFKLRKKIFSVA